MSDSATNVELIPIESRTKTIQTCFRQCLYEVPNFQRPYSWNSEQLEDFWNDVVLAHGDFFFGSTVTWVSEKRDLFSDTYSIIDGQQRLTTSAILISVVRDAFRVQKLDKSHSDSDLNQLAGRQEDATQQYLIVADDDGNSYPVLTRPEKMFHDHIQNPDAIPSRAKWNGSAERIGAARKFFEDRILEEIENLNPNGKIERLKSIRANVLKARVIQVELASEEDGFLVFETLNTRGSDLRLSDLVKNLLIRGGARGKTDRQTISDRWDALIDRVQTGSLNADIADRFIWQSWNSRRKAVKEPELFKQISNLVKSDPSLHLDYLEELETDSILYSKLDDDDVQVARAAIGSREAFAVPEFVDSVRALAIFNVSVANSTILAAARKYERTNLLKRSRLLEVVSLVEKFHFQFSALTNTGSTGGTRSRYNTFAVRLENASSVQEVSDAIVDLKSKLQKSLPKPERVTSEFRALFYAPSLHLTQAQKPRARKIFIAYILMAFAKYHKHLPAGQALSSWSIEHIEPQSASRADLRDPVYSIGNLTLLTSSLNSDLGNAPLQEKATELRKACTYIELVASWP